jgi:O-antigen ligase
MKKYAQLLLGLYAVSTLIGMAIMNIAFVLVLFVFFITYYQSYYRQKKSLLIELNTLPEFKTYQNLSIALGLACLLSLFIAQIHPLLYAGHAPDITAHGYEKIWYLIGPAILFSVFKITNGNEETIKKIIQPWAWATLALTPIAIIQYYSGWPVAQRILSNDVRFHAILWIGHHLSVASIFIFPGFVFLSLGYGKITRGESKFIFDIAVGAAALIILFLSFARTAWISIPIGLALILFKTFTRKKFINTCLMVIPCMALLSQSDAVRYKLQQSDGVQERLELWKANINFFIHRPFTGIGWLKTQEMSEFYFKSISPDNYHRYFWGHAHNNFFEMLGGTGIFGVITWLAWSFFTLKFAHETSNRALALQKYYWSDFCRGIAIALLLLHFNGLTNVTFWEGKVMHQQILAISLVFMVRWAIRTQHQD